MVQEELEVFDVALEDGRGGVEEAFSCRMWVFRM